MARPIRVTGWLAGLAAAGLGTFALCLPFAQYVSWVGDEGILSHGALRLLRGEVLYRDFFEFHPPGGFLLTQAWISAAGASVRSLRWLGVASIVAVALVSYLACNRASRRPALSAALVLAWALSSQGTWTQLNHHWFATVLSMIVAWCALGRGEPETRPAWPALLAGAAAGSAAMITPHQGALTCLAGLTAFGSIRAWRTLGAYLAGCAIAPFGLLAYIASHGALAQAYNDIVLFTLGDYSSVQSVAYGSGSDLQNFPLLLIFPAAALAACGAMAVSFRSAWSDRDLWFCIAIWAAGFLACFPRPDIPHLIFATPLALPLLAKSAARLLEGWPARRQLILLAAVGVLGLPTAWTYAKLAKKVLSLPETEVGPSEEQLAFGNPSVGEIARDIDRTPPGDGFLFYPYMPLMPLITGRRHVADIDIFLPDYTTTEQYYAACVATMRQAKWVVVDREWMDPAYLHRVFPKLKDPSPNETRQFNAALARGFVSAAKAGKVELLKRGHGADPSLCAPIRAEVPQPRTSSIKAG